MRTTLITACFACWLMPLAAAQSPDQTGPWAVGRMTDTVVDTVRDRSLTVDIWYPVDAADTGGALSSYDLVFAALQSSLALDAPPVSLVPARSLVVFSHGSFGIRFQSFFLMEHLASHGFIVVAPDHAGNTAADLIFGTEDPIEQIVVDRPLDVQVVIDRMLERSATPGDAFDNRIDPERIGVAGHSFGGYTAIAQISGTSATAPDPRVRAIMPIAPASGVLTDAELAGVGAPAFILGGTADTTTPIDPQSTRPFELFAGLRQRADIQQAGHQSFTNICVFSDVLLDAGVPTTLIEFLLGSADEGCAPELIPIQDAQQLTNLYATAFLKRVLEGDGQYQQFLNGRHATTQGLPVDFFEANACNDSQTLCDAY